MPRQEPSRADGERRPLALEQRHAAYTAMLEHLTLLPRHRENLLERGCLRNVSHSTYCLYVFPSLRAEQMPQLFINHPNSSIEYFNCSNYRGNRGTCNETHYIRADSLEQVVLLELNRMVSYLKNHAEEFAELLAQKTTKDYERESRNRRQRLQELIARN